MILLPRGGGGGGGTLKRSKSLIYHSPFEPNIFIFGFPLIKSHESLFFRLPRNKYSNKIIQTMNHTPGGLIKFTTNSKAISIECMLRKPIIMPYTTALLSAGIDIYSGNGCKSYHLGSVYPDIRVPIENIFYTGLVHRSNNYLETISVYLPCYAGIKYLAIGLDESAALEPPVKHAIKNPIVFYGSSITQGASASRPGLTYPAIIGRHFDAEVVNLGFSGAAHGEQNIADYIASLEMSAFVMEYDHNTDTLDELNNTHYNFYKTIRLSHANLMIVMLSRSSGGFSCSLEETQARRDVIHTTYEKAIADGDNCTYFIDGGKVIPDLNRSDYFVDGKHPNDAGMKLLAEAIIRVLTDSGFDAVNKYLIS